MRPTHSGKRKIMAANIGYITTPKLPDPAQHNFMKRVEHLQAIGKIQPASLSDLDIRHDDWCKIFKGGYCNCNPDIHVKTWDQANERWVIQ